MCNKKHFFIALFYILTGSFIFRNLLFDPGSWNYADASFPMDESSLDYLVTSIKGVWWNRNFLGYNTVFQTILQTSFILSWKVLYNLLGDFSTMQFAWYVLIFSIGCISMCSLTYHFSGNNIIAFCSGLFYGVNPWIIDRMIVVSIYQAYAFIPALFLFYVLFIQFKKLKFAFFFAICAFFIISSPHYTYYATVLIASYAVFYIFLNRNTIIIFSFINDNFKILIITFIILGFYSIPLSFEFLFNKGGSVKEALERFSGENIAAFFYGKDLSILNSARLLGFHDSFYKKAPLWFDILSLILPIIVVLPLLFRTYIKEKIYYFFYIVILIGVFLSSSTILLNKTVYKKVLLGLPLIKTFASLPDPHYHAFFTAFAYAPVTGLAVFIIIDKIINKNFSFISQHRKTFTTLTLSIFFIFICILGYPLIRWSDSRYKQFHYPEEYRATSEFLQNHAGDSRTYAIPTDHSVRHSWAPYFVSNLDKFIFNVDAFGTGISEATPQESLSYMHLLINEADNKDVIFYNLLRLVNSKYIVLAKDVEADPPYINVDKKKLHFYKNLNSLESIDLVKDGKYLTIYKLNDDHFLPHIYSAPEQIGVMNKLVMSLGSHLD